MWIKVKIQERILYVQLTAQERMRYLIEKEGNLFYEYNF